MYPSLYPDNLRGSRVKKFRLGVAAVLSVAFIAGFASSAHADPDAVEKARAELDAIHQESSRIDQDIIEAAGRAQEAQAKLDQLNKDLLAKESEVEAMASDLGSIAVLQLQSGGFDMTAQLLTSDSDSSFLSSLATIQNEADRSNAALQTLQVGQAEVTRLRSEADRTTTSLQADLKAKEELAKEFDSKEAAAQAVYDRLNAQEQERLRQLEIERQRQRDLADQRAASASRDRGDSSSTVDSSGTGSERAQRAVQVALAQVGKSYVWGTSGPNTFDCSGLTSYAYRQVGISITTSSRAQASLGSYVAKSDLQPGDLVFYYSPISHVAMYIGNGKIVHAANPRTGVTTTKLNSMPYTTARRIA